jgi:hypothetical protein
VSTRNWPSEEEISKQARIAAAHHMTQRLSYGERVEAARDGILDALAKGEVLSLYHEAVAGINAAVAKFSQHYGLPRSGGHTGSQYAAYWAHQPFEWSFADDLIDRIAVMQIMDAIPSPCAQVLRVRAQTGSLEGTATALGIGYKNASYRISVARSAARELWYAPDRDPGQRRYRKAS